MTVKTAAFLALVGTLLLTLLLGANLIQTMVNVARGLTAPSGELASFIYTFASITVTIFFFAFYKSQR